MISDQTKADLKALSEIFVVFRKSEYSELLADFVEAGAEAVNAVCKKALSEAGVEHDPCGEYDFTRGTDGAITIFLIDEEGEEVFIYGEGSV